MIEQKLAIDYISNDSKILVDLFIDNYAENSQTTYINAIRRLKEVINKKEFSELTYVDYEKVLEMFKGTNLSCITSFFQYLFSNDFLKIEDGFEKKFWNKTYLKQHFVNLKESTKEKKQNDYRPALSFEDIEKLITFMKSVSKDDYEDKRLAFCFYALYYMGIQVTSLRTLDAKNFIDGVIKIDGGEILIPTEYFDMFEYYKNRTKSKFSVLDMYIRQLGDKIGINKLIPSQIKSAHDQYSTICPMCGVRYLLEANNWKSVNGKLVCTDCAEQLIESDLKKNYKLSDIDDNSVDILTSKDIKKIEQSVNSFETLRSIIKELTDFDELDEYLNEIGKLGEKYVYEQEKKRLKEAGSKYYDDIDGTPSNDNKNGYDILSYTVKGKPIFIEVKTTPGTGKQSFYMSKNEINKAYETWNSGGIYQIHRVSNIFEKNQEPIVHEVYEWLDEDIFDFEEIVYKVTPKE